MKIVYCVRDKEYSKMILSENKIRIDMVDLSMTQTLSDFSLFLKPNIYYSPEDFLFSLSDEKDTLFNKEKFLDLSQVEHFGWYYGQYHKSQIQLFSMASPQKVEYMEENNPSLLISSFDKYRESYNPVQVTNILNGAIGLCYFSHRENFDQFFKKIKFEKNQWIIDRSVLDKKEYQILALLFLYHNAKTKELNKTIFSGDSHKMMKMYSTYLEYAMNYFVENDYTMDGFLNKMADQCSHDEDLKKYTDFLKNLCEVYVKKGLPFKTEDPFTRFSKDFIDLAKTETNKLNKFKTEKDLTITPIFLVGMLHLGDRINEVIPTDPFIPAIVELTMKHVTNIETTDDQIFITFDNKEFEKNRNNKFHHVQNYIEELKVLKKIMRDIDALSDRTGAVRQSYELHTDIKKIKDSYAILNEDIKEAQEQFDSKKQKLSNYEKEIESIDKELESKRNIFKDKENELSDLKKESSSIDEKIESESKTLDNKKEQEVGGKAKHSKLDRKKKSKKKADKNQVKKETTIKKQKDNTEDLFPKEKQSDK
jgi:hypothetical protein